MATLIIGLAVFLGIHSISIVSPALRNRAVAAMGFNGWRGLYSLISAAGFVLIVYGYGLARQDPVVLYVLPAWTQHLTFLLMPSVFPLLLADVLLFGAFLVWAVFDRLSFRHRPPQVIRRAPPGRFNDAMRNLQIAFIPVFFRL